MGRGHGYQAYSVASNFHHLLLFQEVLEKETKVCLGRRHVFHWVADVWMALPASVKYSQQAQPRSKETSLASCPGAVSCLDLCGLSLSLLCYS